VVLLVCCLSTKISGGLLFLGGVTLYLDSHSFKVLWYCRWIQATVPSQSSNSRSISATHRLISWGRGAFLQVLGYDVFRVNELVFREDGYLCVISGPLVVVRVSGQEVCCRMVLSRSDLDEEPIVLKEAMPTRCATIEVSGLLPVCKIGVIVTTVKGFLAPARWWRQCLRAFTTANNSLS